MNCWAGDLGLGLSAVVITYNEEANIDRCLSALRFADEIVILDSHSTDRTVEIAGAYTDRIGVREFTGFSDQWNAAMELASQEWVLMIGADEVVSDKLAEEIGVAVACGDCDGYRMPRQTFFMGRAMRHCGWYPDYQLRLARRGKMAIPYRLVHETMEVDGPVGVLRHNLVHYSYPSMREYARKMVLYSRTSAEQKLAEGRRCRLSDLIFAPSLTFLKFYVMKQGFRDGMHGFVLSVLQACSAALKYSTLWELTLTKRRDREQSSERSC